MAGRKPKGDIHGKSAVFSTRIKPETRAKLDRAAKESGRSLSQEVERRLEESFGIQRQSDPYLRALAYLVSETGSRIGGNWKSDRWRFRAFVAGVVAILSKLVPEGEPVAPADIPELIQSPEAFGTLIGLSIFSQVRDTSEPTAAEAKEMQLAAGSWAYAMPQARRDLGAAFSARIAKLLLEQEKKS